MKTIVKIIMKPRVEKDDYHILSPGWRKMTTTSSANRWRKMTTTSSANRNNCHPADTLF